VLGECLREAALRGDLMGFLVMQNAQRQGQHESVCLEAPQYLSGEPNSMNVLNKLNKMNKLEYLSMSPCYRA
jgi:hypothetical protein